MSTLGGSGVTLQRPWQMMGALEAFDGMLLFGMSTAYIFSVMQVYWSMLTTYVTPSKSSTREFRELRSQILLHLLTTGFGQILLQKSISGLRNVERGVHG